MGFALLWRMQVFVGELLKALKTQVCTTHHQQRRDGPRCQRADGQCRRHEDGLVKKGALGHRPDQGQLAVGLHATDLLGIEREVVAQHASGFLGCDLGHQRDIVQQGGDVV